MATEALNCSGCGAALNYSGKMVCKCEYCGVTNFLSGESIKNSNRFNRANEERQKCNFDKAIDLYDDLLDEMAPTTDILWGKTLCIFGVEYVEDPVSSEYMPTLHRIGDEDIFECESFKEALKLADDEQKDVLKKDAKAISDLNNEYIRIANEEEPYDVFICYKDTEKDEEGNEVETIDRARGTELFDQLRSRGLKVFFSHRTLKTGEMYEPQIFAALRSSAAMVLLLSNEDYINSVWLKNEWSRFRELKKKDPRRSFFVACERPERLPRWAQQQVSKLSNPGVYVDLASRIKDVLEKQYPERYATKRQDVDISAAMAEAMSKMSFGQGISSRLTEEELGKIYENAKSQNQCCNYDLSNKEVERLIKGKPDYADAYWLRLCNGLNVRMADLENNYVDIGKQADYISAMSYGTTEQKKYYEQIKEKCMNNMRSYAEFSVKKTELIRKYSDRIRGKDIRQKLECDAKQYKKNEKIIEAFFEDDVSKVKIAIGILLFALSTVLFLLSARIDVQKEDMSISDSMCIASVVALVSCIGITLLSSYLKKGWSVVVSVTALVVLIAGDLLLPLILDNYLFFFLAFFISVMIFALLIYGFVMRATLPKKNEKILSDYKSTFVAYGEQILSDIRELFDETMKKLNPDIVVPDVLYSAISVSNYQVRDGELRLYLDDVSMYETGGEVIRR